MDIGEVTTINSYIFGGVSICLNITLILVIRKRSLNIIGGYKNMMIAATLFDVLLSVVYFFASPTFAAVDEESSLLIVKGGIQLPTGYSLALLFMFMWLLCESIVTPPCLFLFRYLQICRSKFLSDNSHWLRCLLILPLSVSSSCCAIICFAAWPSENDIEAFQMIALDINVYGNYTFLVASLHRGATTLDTLQSKATWIGTMYIIIMMLTTVLIMIYCTKCIIQTVRQSSNTKTQKLQIKLYRMLVAQFLVPFLFIHVPFYLSVLAPIFRIDTGSFSNYLPFLFAWSPAINPLIVFYFVGDYRKYLLRTLFHFKEESNLSNHLVISTKKR